MENKHFMQHTLGSTSLLAMVLFFALSFTSDAVLGADEDDIEDIESDMEAVLGESEAAQSEAVDSKKREKEERDRLYKTKKEAADAKNKAAAKEESAKKQIKVLEGKILASQLERKKFEKQKTQADARIKVAEERIAKKKGEFDQAETEKQVARTEKDAQQSVLAEKVKEQKKLEEDIIKDKREFAELSRDIQMMKKQQVDAEKKLELLRKNARKEAERKEKLQAQKDAMARNTAKVPKKVVVRAPKIKCNVTEAASDGAKVIGEIQPGKKYDLFRLVNKRWVELQMGSMRGFAEKACFY